MIGSRKASLGLALALLLAGGIASAEPPASKSHANTLSGTVSSVDATRKNLLVKDAGGKETSFVWTGATHMTGGTLKVGEKVTVRWMAREGKKIATVVKVHAPEAETTAAAPPASVSPTPKAPSR
jgi:hypothetical protein